MKDPEANEASKQCRRTWPQHLAAFSVSLGAMSGGVVLGWATVVQPYLHEEDVTWTGDEITLNRSYPVLSDYENNLVGALPYIGAIFGSLFSGDIADSLGRRRFLLATAVPYILCWLLVMTTELLPILFTSQFVAGVALGITCTITPMYIEEIAEDGIRGALEVYMDVLLTVGTLLTYIAGAYLSFFWLAVGASSIPLLFLFTFFFMPESPVYLLYKGERESAERVLKWLRGSVADQVDQDIEKGIVNLERLLGHFSRIDTTPLLTRILHVPCFIKDVVFNINNIAPATARATFVVCGLMCFQQLCGLNTITTLSVSLLQERRWIVRSQYGCYVIVTSIEAASVVASVFVIDRVGRRVLLLVSGGLMAMCLGTLAINSFLSDGHAYPWVLILITNGYIVAYSVGMGPVPFVLCAELSPMKDKNAIEPLANFINWGLSFFVNQYLNGYLQDMGGLHSFSIFCALCVAGTCFVYLWIPETKRKSREEIQIALANSGTSTTTTTPSTSEC